VKLVACVTTGFPFPISDARLGSVATDTEYLAAPGTAVQARRNGWAGNVIVAPSAGAVRSGDDAQFLVKDCAADQPETAPSAATAWTCHQ
jgi:hypothetical protein